MRIIKDHYSNPILGIVATIIIYFIKPIKVFNNVRVINI